MSLKAHVTFWGTTFVLSVLGAIGSWMLAGSLSGCHNPPPLPVIEAGIVQLVTDTCKLVDPNGGLNPVVDVLCQDVQGRSITLRMRRAEYQAMRAAAVPHDGGQ